MITVLFLTFAGDPYHVFISNEPSQPLNKTDLNDWAGASYI